MKLNSREILVRQNSVRGVFEAFPIPENQIAIVAKSEPCRIGSRGSMISEGDVVEKKLKFGVDDERGRAVDGGVGIGRPNDGVLGSFGEPDREDEEV